MKPYQRISAAIAKANTEGRTALVPFITAGYPKKAGFIDDLKTIAAIGDVIEIGVPFSDPMADGLTIQRSSHGAISQGVSLRWILTTLSEARDSVSAPLVLMSYLNPLLAYGIDELASNSEAAGVCGYIIPDLPFEESAEIGETLRNAGLGLIQLVTPATPEARLERLAAASQGFVYAVTVRGITGSGAALPPDTTEYLKKVAHYAGDTPVCAGFGIRSPEQVRDIGQHVNGAVVGSALIEVQESGGDAAEFLTGLRG